MRKHIGVLLAMLALLIVPLPVSAETATRYDNYTTGYDSFYESMLSNWTAQTFTTAQAFELDKIRLNLAVEGEPGTLIVSIRATNATDVPNGIDLTSGYVLDAELATTQAWYEFDVDDISLAENTTYAIVIRSTGITDAVNFHIGRDGSTGAYAGGSEWDSTDGGYTWAADTDNDYLFELWGFPVLGIYSAAVFNSYYAANDWLVVLAYKNVYEPYCPAIDPQSHFVIQLLSVDGGTVIAQKSLAQWGYKPAGIYLSASTASPLEWGSAYIIRILGLDAPYSSVSYTLTGMDWKGTDLAVLDSWCIATAHGMEYYYDADYVELTAEKGEVLNEEGGVLFDVGITGLAVQRGETLYQVAVSGIPYSEGTWTSSYTGGRDEWYTQLGPDISNNINATADLVDADGKTLLMLIILGGYMAVAVIMIMNGMNSGAFAVLAPFLLFGYAIKVLPWPVLGVIVAILVMMAMRQLWWKST